jgi:hypothetical protein
MASSSIVCALAPDDGSTGFRGLALCKLVPLVSLLVFRSNPRDDPHGLEATLSRGLIYRIHSSVGYHMFSPSLRCIPDLTRR